MYNEQEQEIIANIVSEDCTMTEIVLIAAPLLPNRTLEGIKSYIISHGLPYLRVRQRWDNVKCARVAERIGADSETFIARVSDVSSIDRPRHEMQNRLNPIAALRQAKEYLNRNH